MERERREDWREEGAESNSLGKRNGDVLGESDRCRILEGRGKGGNNQGGEGR